ncbi:TetR family transcriptional regulator [Gordonia spumicola]|uniref:TetR family transcriptional regulator n=1 Tax=Gordonia spumicola TaxID=589161 RepID=A0A7I9VBM3_9ACTN|nr:TetR family transcriptional regulator [Gordonia spumicola]GEE02430.1 TetR family transcriptional regulator [Gordonia spumicola]
MRQSTPRRGRPPSITRDQIVERALVRLDDAGVDGLTMKDLASDLGVTTMSLYRHVDDKETLLALALDAIAEPFASIVFPEEPRACIRLAMTTLYVTLTAHPWVPEALIRPQRIGRGALLLTDAVMGATYRLTGDRAAALTAYRALWSLTLGSVLSHLRQRAEGTPLSHGRMDDLLGAMPRDALPDLRASATLDERPSTEEDFAASLSALMHGLFGPVTEK